MRKGFVYLMAVSVCLALAFTPLMADRTADRTKSATRGATSTTDWNAYEGIQADIFDHLMAIVPHFGLSLYQHPTGADFSRLIEG